MPEMDSFSDNFYSMCAKPSREVDVLIFEDDRYFNDLLAEKIRDLNRDQRVQVKGKLSVRQVFDPETYFMEPAAGRADHTIAFIDFYLGNGYTGASVSDRLLVQDSSIRIVLLSGSEDAIRYVGRLKLNSALYTKLVKHEYTPEICCIIVEDFLQNL